MSKKLQLDAEKIIAQPPPHTPPPKYFWTLPKTLLWYSIYPTVVLDTFNKMRDIHCQCHVWVKFQWNNLLALVKSIEYLKTEDGYLRTRVISSSTSSFITWDECFTQHVYMLFSLLKIYSMRKIQTYNLNVTFFMF